MRRTGTHRVLYWILSLVWGLLCIGFGFFLAWSPSDALAARGEDKAITEEMQTDEPVPTEASSTPPPESLQLSVQRSVWNNGISMHGDQPKILIYHTHTTEAYFPTEQYSYTESSRWRTKDSDRNVVAVGERLKEILETEYGYSVIHDTTDHEPPKLATAYERSEQTMLRYRQQYPSITLYIDLHRDAFGTEPTQSSDYVTVNGEDCARIMFVVGQGVKYADKPFFERNYAIAKNATEYLNVIADHFTRPIRIKTGRYNQHIAPGCLLVEVGHNANTLEQALHSVPYLAEGIAIALAQIETGVSSWVPEPGQNLTTEP